MLLRNNNLIISDRRKCITIRDVMQAAGISTQTVSYVINKFSYVSGETRHLISTMIEIIQMQYEYQPIVAQLKFIEPTLIIRENSKRTWLCLYLVPLFIYPGKKTESKLIKRRWGERGKNLGKGRKHTSVSWRPRCMLQQGLLIILLLRNYYANIKLYMI